MDPNGGKIIKIAYKGIKNLCNKCYGSHLKKDCKNDSKTWPEYVNDFADQNPEINGDFYGKLWEKIYKHQTQN